MNRIEALAAVEASFAMPSATPCTWREDRDAYIAEEKAKLLACLIEPVEVQAVATDWAQQYCGQTNETKSMIAVARRENSWLLFEPNKGVFALAFGTSTQLEPLSLLGFASTDALAEWLG
jgi:hypothetical protein